MFFLNLLFFHFTFSFHEMKSYGFTEEEGIPPFHSFSLVICSQDLPNCLHFQAQFFEWKFSKLGLIKSQHSWGLLKLLKIFRMIKDLFSLKSQYWNTVWKWNLDSQISLKLLSRRLAPFAAWGMCSSVARLNFASMGSECGQQKFCCYIVKFSFEEDWRL